MLDLIHQRNTSEKYIRKIHQRNTSDKYIEEIHQRNTSEKETPGQILHNLCSGKGQCEASQFCWPCQQVDPQVNNMPTDQKCKTDLHICMTYIYVMPTGQRQIKSRHVNRMKERFEVKEETHER